MQPALFEDDDDTSALLAAPVTDELRSLAARLHPQLHLGTSSWHFPGWRGLVWGGTTTRRRCRAMA